MQPPADANEKAYIPTSPKVLESTQLVQPDETGTLSFTAPKQPGEYVFLCTSPGHWNEKCTGRCWWFRIWRRGSQAHRADRSDDEEAV